MVNFIRRALRAGFTIEEIFNLFDLHQGSFEGT
jgi:DNA-binding transcriptional MerR regulator